MNQEKFGKFIKKLRKENNLTQKELAEKYNVTYQAVSKWENGINMPDKALIKQISKDFNISLEELFEGEFKPKKSQTKTILTISLAILTIIVVALIIILLIPKEKDFEFKTLSSNCSNFNISGNIAYNKNKSAIYITNIEYCGGNDMDEYHEIECVLYESNNDTEKRISSYKYDEDKYIKLEDFLQDVTFSIDNYQKTCKEYQDNSLYLLINATNKEDRVITYKVPLALDDTCKNK